MTGDVIVRQAMAMYVLADGRQRTLTQLRIDMDALSDDQIVEAVQEWAVVVPGGRRS